MVIVASAHDDFLFRFFVMRHRILKLNIVLVLSSRGAAVAISSPSYFSAQVLCFGQGLHQRESDPQLLLRRARGYPRSFLILLSCEVRTGQKYLPDRTLEGHNRPTVAPPQRLRAPSTIRLCLFLGGGACTQFSYSFLARDNFCCLFLLPRLPRALDSDRGVRPSHHLCGGRRTQYLLGCVRKKPPPLTTTSSLTFRRRGQFLWCTTPLLLYVVVRRSSGLSAPTLDGFILFVVAGPRTSYSRHC